MYRKRIFLYSWCILFYHIVIMFNVCSLRDHALDLEGIAAKLPDKFKVGIFSLSSANIRALHVLLFVFFKQVPH